MRFHLPDNELFTSLEVANLFQPSIEAAVASIRNQIDTSGGVIKVAIPPYVSS